MDAMNLIDKELQSSEVEDFKIVGDTTYKEIMKKSKEINLKNDELFYLYDFNLKWRIDINLDTFECNLVNDYPSIKNYADKEDIKKDFEKFSKIFEPSNDIRTEIMELADIRNERKHQSSFAFRKVSFRSSFQAGSLYRKNLRPEDFFNTPLEFIFYLDKLKSNFDMPFCSNESYEFKSAQEDFDYFKAKILPLKINLDPIEMTPCYFFETFNPDNILSFCACELNNSFIYACGKGGCLYKLNIEEYEITFENLKKDNKVKDNLTSIDNVEDIIVCGSNQGNLFIWKKENFKEEISGSSLLKLIAKEQKHLKEKKNEKGKTIEFKKEEKTETKETPEQNDEFDKEEEIFKDKEKDKSMDKDSSSASGSVKDSEIGNIKKVNPVEYSILNLKIAKVNKSILRMVYTDNNGKYHG
ncbi:MAG: hypothetical protein MJ252_13840, partial [archaeon]|nr:hypothetical protein [archaeon]